MSPLSLSASTLLLHWVLTLILSQFTPPTGRRKREDGSLPLHPLQQIILEGKKGQPSPYNPFHWLSGLDEFENNDVVIEEEEDHDVDNKGSEVSQNSASWYVTATNGLINVIEEAADDLICDDESRGTANTSLLFRCNEKLKDEENRKIEMNRGKGKCKLEVWRCFSGVLEGIVKHVDDLGYIYR